MKDKNQNPPPPPSEKRRAEFAPHENPKKQPDGDPGPTSARQGPVDESSPEAPERVEDDRPED
jgi:hypothetical protein